VLLRRRLARERVDVTDESRPLYRELMEAGLMVPLHTMTGGDESAYRLTEAGVTFATRVGLSIVLGGLATSALVYLLVERTFRPLAEEKGLDLGVEIVGATVPPTIVTDEQRLQQILKNLLSNAVKFTEEGAVTMRVEVASGDVQFAVPTLALADTVLAFSVIDTGIGIADDKLRVIFEAFQQADGTTSRKFGGTGLGLSISREITRLLGGEIHVESEVGTGSTFTLFLPARYVERPEPQPSGVGVDELRGDLEPAIRRHGGDLAVESAVHLGAPRPGCGVGSGEIVGRQIAGDDQIRLGVAHEVLHDSLRFGVGSLTEVGAEAVVGGEAHVLRRRHHHVGDHGCLQAGHPIRQHDLGDAAEGLQGLRQQPQRRLGALVGGEGHEAPPAPRRHGAEHMQRPLRAPVDHEGVARRPHCRTASPVLASSPGLLRSGHEATQVAGRSGVARRPGLRQQPLGADASPGRLDAPGDHAGDDVVVAGAIGLLRRETPGVVSLDGSSHGLVGRPAHGGGSPVRAHLSVGGNQIHAFLR